MFSDDSSYALQNEPLFKYLLPDEQLRRTVLSWFFRQVRASQLSGEIYTTQNIEDGFLWVSPGYAFEFELLVRAGALGAPFKLGWSNFRRCVQLCRRMEAVHQRMANGPHWRLMPLGLKPSKFGSGLVQLAVSRADSDGLPCYLET